VRLQILPGREPLEPLPLHGWHERSCLVRRDVRTDQGIVERDAELPQCLPSREGKVGPGGTELPARTKRTFCPLERKALAPCRSRRCARHDGRAARDTLKPFSFAMSISSDPGVGPATSAAFATHRNRFRSLQCAYRARRQCRWALDFMAPLHEERPRRLGEDEPSREAHPVWHRVLGRARDLHIIFYVHRTACTQRGIVGWTRRGEGHRSGRIEGEKRCRFLRNASAQCSTPAQCSAKSKRTMWATHALWPMAHAQGIERRSSIAAEVRARCAQRPWRTPRP